MDESGTKSMASVKSEITELTALRGLGAIWVLMFHMTPITLTILPEAIHFQPLIENGYFAVAMFFILSGYVLDRIYADQVQSPGKFKRCNFYLRRWIRVYPVHIVTFAFLVAMQWLGVLAQQPADTLPNAVLTLLLVQAWVSAPSYSWNYPSWSISAEMFAYLLFPLLAVLFSRLSTRSSKACAICLLTILAITSYTLISFISFRDLVCVVSTFCLGMGLSRAVKTTASTHSYLYSIALVAIIVLPFYTERAIVLSAGFIIAFSILISIAGLDSVKVLSGDNILGKAMKRLGDMSYSIYMTHAITISLIGTYVPYGSISDRYLLIRIAAEAAVVFLIVGTAYMFYFIVESPLQKTGRNLLVLGK